MPEQPAGSSASSSFSETHSSTYVAGYCFATSEVTVWLPHFNGDLRAETAFLKLLHLKASNVGLTDTTWVLIPRGVLVPGTHFQSL